MRLFLTVFLFQSLQIYGQGINFFQEDITFKLNKNFFEVDGFYWFINQSDNNLEKIIYYPFGTDSIAGQIDSVEVYNITKSSKQKVLNLSKQGLVFLLEITPHDTEVYHIKYHQKIIYNNVKYILTSTQKWNKPLDNAEYKLIVDKDIEVTQFSYNPDKVYNIEGKKIFFWKRNNFMPKSDMIFQFK